MAISVPCPACGHDRSQTTDSRPAIDGTRRRRRCLSCGLRFSTRESLHDPSQQFVNLTELPADIRTAIEAIVDFAREHG
jgi:transcriptional regulator NrdR family protein